MDFATHFKLGRDQSELDFVNIDIGKDLELFVDPYAIEIKDDEWSNKCGDHIASFFEEVLAALRQSNARRASDLVAHLKEPQDTFLGVSSGTPRGRGVGSFQADLILDALRKSVAFQTGLLSDLAEAELFIEGIGRDKISDLTTNIIRGPLLEYTKEQCQLHNVPLRRGIASAPLWRPDRSRWESQYVDMPVISGKPVLLVPKYSVRRRLSLDSQEFYNHHMLNFLQTEHLNANSGLVHVLKNRTRKVYKKDLRERHPFVKDDLAKFVQEHPQVLETYKKLKGAQEALGNTDLNEGFDEGAFARALIGRLAEIDVGNDAASTYHGFCVGALTFLFYPWLIYPIKEKEIHEGRKRIDIVFTNAAVDGFFQRMMIAAQTRSISIFVECKNYGSEIGNPEIDQLQGRFGHQRGFFGLLLCRKVRDRTTLTKRCKDTATDGRGFIVVLDDGDLIKCLELVVSGRREQISQYLQNYFDALTH